MEHKEVIALFHHLNPLGIFTSTVLGPTCTGALGCLSLHLLSFSANWVPSVSLV